ncbi:hypothetical protein Pmar_PMAR009341 [Perkinsus marinus ATCC 50983]|uniref:Uncharacterized protein n=1 Tax=Perkinsus marinus (strain ATCC 50983 / TXsc) TaxID=423536 RepID=C5LHG3_PERM5|nr:hypothetical protein Pmar_PMAR009341 [Perkinsus marinus ATCC 50983]EER03813.1 hypothetical protein Pmar_PMAR009341 [Perkinsus marinus ATCC 50983]|eukprot:XP_002771997.1 hypothetical protein Pmar_PMAR009341 [Perkinsus marinus ATCC 50983]
MLVFVVGPITIILNNRVWAALFDAITAFSFTAAYLIISGHILLPDNMIGVDRYLLEIAKNPELTRVQRRTSLRYYVIALISWTIGISGFVYVAITQFKGDCNELIPNFDSDLINRVALSAVASKKKVELTGRLFWHGFFTLEALDTVLQIIRLVELGGRSFTGERVIVADRTAIMTQATLIMLVFVVGPTTLILNNRVWAALFDTIVAFSFTAAYLIISGRIFLPDTWPDLRFETFVSFLSSLVPAILSLDNVIGVDRYLYEIAKNPELTRGRKRTCLRSRIIVFISWTIGISGFVYVAITQFKGNCNELIPNFDSECLVPVYPILDSQSCDCRMAFVYLDAPCVEEDMTRVLFYNRLQYLSISDRNTAPSTSCNNQQEALFNAVSKLSELVVLNLVAVPIESLSIGALTKMEVMAATATPLAIVPDDVHLRLPSIRSFQFELSQIQELPFDSLRQMRYLEYIGLAGSPICSGVDFPEWTDGIIDCGLGYDETCVVDESLSKLSQTITGYCRKWISSGAPTICLPSCDITHETLVSTDVDGSNTLSVQENTAILQSFGLVPQGTEMSAAFHQCVMRSCGKDPSDELAFDVASVIFLLGKSNCEECDS